MDEGVKERYDESALPGDGPESGAPGERSAEGQFEAELEAEAAAFLAAVPWWVVLLEGIAVIFVGVMLLTQTRVTTLVLVSFFGWYWLIHGGFEIAGLFWDRSQWGWRLAGGVLGVLAGLYILAAPAVGAAVVLGVATVMLGLNGVVIGAASVAKAFSGGGWGVGVFGVLSAIIGLSIAFDFPRYMLALPWVWGVMAVVAGLMSLVAALNIRKLQAQAA